MKRPYYIVSSGRLRRKDNTVFFEPSKNKEITNNNNAILDDEVLAGYTDESVMNPETGRVDRKPIPVQDIEAFYCLGELDFNSKFFNFLSQNKILLHQFNFYGHYAGSFIPRKYLQSGFTVVEQVKAYLDTNRRLMIARELISSASYNIIKNLKYYAKPSRGEDKVIDFSSEIMELEKLSDAIYGVETISELMGIEGNIRDRYYNCWGQIVGNEFALDKRIKHHPNNAINALISFANGLVYATVLSEIYHTHLDPTVSFLHSPGERRFSLALDLAEIFKPLIADRMIFRLLNSKQIQEKHFRAELNFCYLEESGRNIVLKEYDERLKTTIKHRSLDRNVSYRHLIRLEAYKLVRHIATGEEYKAFRTWW